MYLKSEIKLKDLFSNIIEILQLYPIDTEEKNYTAGIVIVVIFEGIICQPVNMDIVTAVLSGLVEKEIIYNIPAIRLGRLNKTEKELNELLGLED